MNEKTIVSQIINRRIFLIFLIQSVMMLVLIYRLFSLQIVKHSSYSDMSSNNHIRTIIEPVPRGQILDSKGNILADNIYEYSLIIDSKQIKELDVFLERLNEIFDLTNKEEDSIISFIKKKKRFIHFKSISFEEFIHFQYQIDNLPEILITKKYLRIYPYESAMAHIVGYVINENKKYDNDYYIYSNDFKVGKIGVEKKFDEILRGENQTVRISVDARGNKVCDVDTIVGRSGDVVKTSLDGELQKMICDEFTAINASGSAVVIDIQTVSMT